MKLATIKQGGKRIAVNIQQIEWIETFDVNASRIHFASGGNILVDEGITEVVKSLNAAADGVA